MFTLDPAFAGADGETAVPSTSASADASTSANVPLEGHYTPPPIPVPVPVTASVNTPATAPTPTATSTLPVGGSSGISSSARQTPGYVAPPPSPTLPPHGEVDGGGDGTAWAGVDAALSARFRYLRALPTMRARRQGRDVGQELVGDCTLCEEEGRVFCRGDVAVGVCEGGCVEVRFLGRGKGNGCEDA